MKRLLYYEAAKQYYWLDSDASTQSRLVLTKSEFEELKPMLTPVDTNINPLEITVFLLFAVATISIILTAR